MFDVKVRMIDEVIHIHDDFRKKFVVLTPEEWVRQHFAHYLTGHLGYPKGRLKMEYKIKYNGRTKRPDIGILDRDGAPFIMVECKAPSVPLTEAVLLQVATYFSVEGGHFIAMTNGIQHIVAQVKPSEPKLVYMKELPSYT